jgi:hypothetical protein
MPRLSTSQALDAFTLLGEKKIQQVAEFADKNFNNLNQTYASTGGVRIDTETLVNLRMTLRGIAQRGGYPDSRTDEGRSLFDREAALVLRSLKGLSQGEGCRAETWQYLSAGLVPDLITWRFSRSGSPTDVSQERYIGALRNCLGRLWLRATLLWDERLADPGLFLSELSEDNLVQLTERTYLAIGTKVHRAVARAFVLRKRTVGRALQEDLMRDAMKRVTRASAYASLWTLDESDLDTVIGNIFNDSLKSFSINIVDDDILLQSFPSLQYLEFPTRSVVLQPPVEDVHSLDPPMRTGEPVGQATHVSFVSPAPLRAVLEASFSNPPAGSSPDPKFRNMKEAEQINTLWNLVIGIGATRFEDIIRIAALKLREQGLVSFQRLRQGGEVHTNIRNLIEKGVRKKRFDVPMRGFRRAVVARASEVPVALVEQLIRERDVKGMPPGTLIPSVVSDLCERVGKFDDGENIVNIIFQEIRASEIDQNNVINENIKDIRIGHSATENTNSRVAESVFFNLTANNLAEGGRDRKGEAYLNVNKNTYTFFSSRNVTICTDSGAQFPARLSGSSGSGGSDVPKNLRSSPASALGAWLIGVHNALPGDEVQATRQSPGTFRFVFIRKTGLPSSHQSD